MIDDFRMIILSSRMIDLRFRMMARDDAKRKTSILRLPGVAKSIILESSCLGGLSLGVCSIASSCSKGFHRENKTW